MGGRSSRENKTNTAENSIIGTKYVNQNSNKDVKKETSVDHGKIVIALDIGTENMGYALSCYTRKNKIYTVKNSGSQQRDRMPTAFLLNDDHSLNSFGFTAVSCHSNLLLKKLHSKYSYFRKFEIKLLEQEEVASDCRVKDSNEEIIYHYMEVLKRHALETTQNILFCEGEHFEENIEWVLTIPHNLTKKGEDVVFRAAKKAELERINLVTESEAAAWYCQRTQLKISWQNEITNMLQGHKFAVADLGAGKASICVYEVKSDGTLDILAKPQFLSNAGGNSVNEEFESFMKRICGPSSWNKFRTNHKYDYEKLMSLFEDEKVKFDYNTECIVITLPKRLLSIIKKSKGIDKLLDKAELIEDKLFIYRNQMEDYFKPSYQQILNTLKRIRENTAVADLNELVLVGGYSASMFIRTKLKEECHSFDIAFAQDPEMVVLKGAVMIGLENRRDLSKKPNIVTAV